MTGVQTCALPIWIRALEQVASLRPDLVLADVQMPGMDGLEATRRIKTQPGAPRVIVFTIHDTGCYRDAAKGAGADLFIPKGKLGVLLAPAILSLFS